ncbi:hypothetical protein [Pleionea sediminis]|uniref:hypothetical protein n=1 Tax=Pleionea sediminis TaxID=2569479 RepID=UPI00118671C6|nr:hypothetical protein [Pleionea sediminis]
MTLTNSFHKHNVLWLATTCSLVLHGLLLIFLWNQKLTPKLTIQSDNQIHIQLTRHKTEHQPKSSLNETQSKEVPKNTQTVAPKKTDFVVPSTEQKAEPDTQPTRTQKPINSTLTSSPKEVPTDNNGVISVSKAQSTTIGLDIYSNLKAHANQHIENHPLTINEPSINSNDRIDTSNIFDSELVDKIRRREDEKRNNELLEHIRSEIDSHRYREFQSIGGQQMVRIDGNCYSVPEDDPLDEFDNPIMMGAGACSKKKSIEFKSYAPHIIKKRAQQVKR